MMDFVGNFVRRFAVRINLECGARLIDRQPRVQHFGNFVGYALVSQRWALFQGNWIVFQSSNDFRRAGGQPANDPRSTQGSCVYRTHNRPSTYGKYQMLAANKLRDRLLLQISKGGLSVLPKNIRDLLASQLANELIGIGKIPIQLSGSAACRPLSCRYTDSRSGRFGRAAGRCSSSEYSKITPHRNSDDGLINTGIECCR